MATSSNHGVACSNKSNLSMSVVSLPEANILSFSASCGSGEKGAGPSQRHNAISREQGTRRNLCA